MNPVFITSQMPMTKTRKPSHFSHSSVTMPMTNVMTAAIQPTIGIVIMARPMPLQAVSPIFWKNFHSPPALPISSFSSDILTPSICTLPITPTSPVFSDTIFLSIPNLLIEPITPTTPPSKLPMP